MHLFFLSLRSSRVSPGVGKQPNMDYCCPFIHIVSNLCLKCSFSLMSKSDVSWQHCSEERRSRETRLKAVGMQNERQKKEKKRCLYAAKAVKAHLLVRSSIWPDTSQPQPCEFYTSLRFISLFHFLITFILFTKRIKQASVNPTYALDIHTI